MATSDANGFPTKNKAYRMYFYIHDNMGLPITAVWTGIAGGCQVIIDGVLSGVTRNIVQVATTNCGYVDLPASDINSSATGIRCAITNTNALAFEAVLFPILTDPVATANPTTLNLDQMIAQLWQYHFGRVTNDGTNIKMFDVDGTTQLAVMAITGQVEKGAGY